MVAPVCAVQKRGYIEEDRQIGTSLIEVAVLGYRKVFNRCVSTKFFA